VLRVSRQIASELLAESIEQGEALLERASLIGDLSDYESWKTTRKLWIDRTEEALGRAYDGPAEADGFRSAASAPAGEQDWQVEYRRDANCVREAIDVLFSLQDHLERTPTAGSELKEDPAAGPEFAPDPAAGPEFAPDPAAGPEFTPDPAAGPDPDREPAAGPQLEEEPADDTEPEQPRAAESELERGFSFSAAVANGSSSPLPATTSAGDGGDRSGQVFLVHGRDESLKRTVADLLECAGPHEVTILNERPCDRRMLVEHFDEHAA